MIAVPVLQVVFAVVVALFVLQVTRRLAAGSSNTILKGYADGVSFLTAP